MCYGKVFVWIKSSGCRKNYLIRKIAFNLFYFLFWYDVLFARKINRYLSRCTSRDQIFYWIEFWWLWLNNLSGRFDIIDVYFFYFIHQSHFFIFFDWEVWASVPYFSPYLIEGLFWHFQYHFVLFLRFSYIRKHIIRFQNRIYNLNLKFTRLPQTTHRSWQISTFGPLIWFLKVFAVFL